METPKCPECDSKVQTTPKRYYEDETQFEAWCPVCNVWWYNHQLDNDEVIKPHRSVGGAQLANAPYLIGGNGTEEF